VLDYDAAHRMFSTRTRWDLRPNRLSRLLAAKHAAGVRVLDLTESNPTRAGISDPEDLLAPLAQPDGRSYDPAPLGLSAARAAVAADFERRGAPLDSGRIVLTASTSEAYGFLFKLLCDPGDEILVPRPGYPLFEYLGSLESVHVRGYPLEHDGSWRVDLEAVRRAVSPRTRAMVVVSPGNPTGAYLTLNEREGLEALAAERGLALVSDEVFADFAFSSHEELPPSVAHDGPALAFTLGGLSKSCGLPQLKLAWMAVTGPEDRRREALERLEVVADTYLSVSTPVQLAAAELLARREELQAPIRERTRTNLEALRSGLGPRSPASLLEPEGGWYAVLRVPATVSEEERVSRLLEERDVHVHPGYFFDFPREAYLVVSLLPSPAVFAEATDRLLADLVL
jgi:aspartate/methionine/tyrosine aminotransferase